MDDEYYSRKTILSELDNLMKIAKDIERYSRPLIQSEFAK